MPFYLSEYTGTGTKQDPFVPVGAGEDGWQAINLRAAGLNACLLFAPSAISDPRARLLANTKDSPVTNQTRNFVQNKLGVDLTGKTTFSEIVGEIMRHPPAGKWNAVLPTQERFEVWLGELVYEEPL